MLESRRQTHQAGTLNTTSTSQVMKCEEAAEFVSALCDGESIPAEAAGHIGACDAGRARLREFVQIGAELRRAASLETPAEAKVLTWETIQSQRFQMEPSPADRGSESFTDIAGSLIALGRRTLLNTLAPGTKLTKLSPNPWTRILDALEKRINKHSYDTWLKPTRYSHSSGGILFIRVPTVEFRHAGDKYADLIQEAIDNPGLEFSSSHSGGDSEENLITLCATCHGIAHQHEKN